MGKRNEEHEWIDEPIGHREVRRHHHDDAPRPTRELDVFGHSLGHCGPALLGPPGAEQLDALKLREPFGRIRE